MAFFHSIRFRLTLWFVAILAVVLAIFSSLIFWTQARDLRTDAAGHLQEQNERLQGLLGSENEGAELGDAGAFAGESLLRQGDILLLTDRTGAILQEWGSQIVEPGAVVANLIGPADARAPRAAYLQRVQISGTGSQSAPTDYLFVSTPVGDVNDPIGYLIMGSKTDLISQQHRLALLLSMGSLGMLVIAFLGGLWLADRAMRPVAEIASAARTITESDLGRRLHIRGRDELADLAATFDGMISRLQDAFDRQRRFVADASHELRTPLTIINLEAARALEAQRTPSEYKNALQVVQAEGTRMTRLVNDLMTLARMDSGQEILKPEDVNLSDVAGEALARISPLAAQRKVTLESSPLPEVMVSGDKQYLLQMISNLLENGVKYSGSGQRVRIDIFAGEHASLRVSDTGPGIPPEHLPAVFDRFYRVDQARSQNEEDLTSPSGSGLGLSIVAWIVHAHGGQIFVDSKMNQGTTFEVTLPLSTVHSSKR